MMMTLVSCKANGVTDPARGLRVEPLEAEYRRGELADLRLTNVSDELLGYNGCMVKLERRTVVGWSEVSLPLRVCDLVLDGRLDPGAQATVRAPLPAILGAGTYRYTLLAVRRESGELLPEAERRSETFTVTA